jgi:aminopeptidase N
MDKRTPPTTYLRDYIPLAHVVEKIDLDVALKAEGTRIKSRLTVAHNPRAAKPSRQLVLDGENITLIGVAVDGRSLAPQEYGLEDDRLVLNELPQRRFEVSIENICSPKSNTQLSGLYLSNGIYCTQCEAEGFRRITYFPDRPDVLTRFRVRLEAERDEAPVLLANGNLIDHGAIEGSSRHFVVWDDPFPKPSYLFAMVGGRLARVEDNFITRSGRNISLHIYVEPGNEGRCQWAMQSIKTAMAWDEKAFGREYDLDLFMVVAVSSFNMGAMENKGLNIFNDKYVLARPESATDTDYTNIEAIIAHEYFHNWTGNRITCRDWFQLCLKEGLTVFRDQEFSSDVRSRAVKRIEDVRALRTHQFPEDQGPLAHPVRPTSYIEINNFYTATVYEKGAEVVRMMQTLLGRRAFRKGMDLYFTSHDGEAVTVEDFVRCMEDASGRDLRQFFLWYEQAGTPEVKASGRWNRRTKTFVLTLTQNLPPTPGQRHKKPHHIPIAVGLVGANGHDMDTALDGAEKSVHILELVKKSTTFRFRNTGSQPVLSLNRGFSAPIRLTTALTTKELLFLIANDSDAFNRWEAAQTIGRQLIVDCMRRLKSRRSLAEPKAFAEALRQALKKTKLDCQFLSLLLTLPAEQDVAGAIGHNVDPQLVHDAHRTIMRKLGLALEAELEICWQKNATRGAYSPDPQAVGRRSLRHAVLGLIAAADTARGTALAVKHFRTSSNMTEKFAALGVLIKLDVAQRDEALQSFYDQHHYDHLLVDKWFALQAQIPHRSTVERVRKLLGHPQFNWEVPNRLRALIGSFANANPTAFNAADGSGYQLLADVIERLDRQNPQIAARLAASFKGYKILELRRRRRAEEALRAILKIDGLSRDSFEIASRCLQ